MDKDLLNTPDPKEPDISEIETEDINQIPQNVQEEAAEVFPMEEDSDS